MGRQCYQKAVGWARQGSTGRADDAGHRSSGSRRKPRRSPAWRCWPLLEEGKLSLSDLGGPLHPGLREDQRLRARSKPGVTVVPARRPITIRDLLTHTAGISYGVQPEIAGQYNSWASAPAAGFGWYFADKDEPVCGPIERLATLPFVAQPGEAWVYGYNTDVLGCVVERVSGQALDQFIRARITDPLGMKDTTFFLAPEQRDRLAAVYASGSDGKSTRAPDGARGQGSYVERPAQDVCRRRGAAVHGARLRPLPGDDSRRRLARRRPHPGAPLRGPHEQQPGGDAALGHRPGLRPRLRDHRSLRRQRHGHGGLLRGGAAPTARCIAWIRASGWSRC